MSDRAPRYGLEPQACPFVALADDRDRRLEVPDERHRCYAEPDPQPRAEAHQRAYCLSPAFAACPIFLDWAARAAAEPAVTGQTLPTAAQLANPTDLPPPARPTDPASRDWAAPPPWSGSQPQPRPRPASEQLSAFVEPDEQARDVDVGDLGTDPGAAAAGSLGTADARNGIGPIPSATPAAPPSPELPPFLAGRERLGPPYDVGRMADRPPAMDGDRWATRHAGRRPAIAGQARPAPVRPERPEWARSRRSAAYPTLRTRGLRHAPTIVAAIVGIAITALALFLLAGVLGAGGLPTLAPTGSPTPAPSPTPTPSPSPVTYTVRAGDTLFAIAKDHGLTVEQIVCANGIVDPDVLQPGQVLIIPEDTFECPADGDDLPTLGP